MSLTTLGVLERGNAVFCFNRMVLCFELTSRQEVARAAGSSVTSGTAEGGKEKAKPEHSGMEL